MKPDRILGACLFLFGSAYLALTFLIPQPSGGYAAVGPRAFPVIIGVGLVGCSIWIGLSGTPTLPVRELPVDWRRFAWSALTFLAYILLLDSVGYVLATVGFITLESRLLGSRSWVRSLIVGCAVTALVYGVFRSLLEIPLPEGLIG